MGIGNWMMIWTAAMPLAVLIYYFFRKKYTVRQIPSTLFWEEMMKEWQASPYVKKLQQHLLFYLQMAALLLFVFLLLEPYAEQQSLQGDEWVFVADVSATMLAGSPSRLELQQERMKDLVGEANGKPVTLVIAGANPEVKLRKERESDRIFEAIDELAVQYEAAEMEQTLLFADTLADSDSTVMHIFTDSLDRTILANRVKGTYTVYGFEEQPINVSVRQFGVTERDGGMSAIVQVTNDSDETLLVTVEVTDGTTTEVEQVELEAGQEQLVAFDSLPMSLLWTARIEADDEYGADNEMSAYVQSTANQVVVDASLHELVAAGFDSLGAGVQLMASEQLTAGAGYPVATSQTRLLGEAEPVLLIGRDDAEAKEAEGNITTEDHPLFTYADLESVYVAEVYPPFENYETIAFVGEDPWIQTSPTGDIAILSDIQSTDWPLSPSFPLFLWSALNELSGSRDFLGVFRPNETRALSLGSEAGEWDVYRETEFIRTYRGEEGAFTAPSVPGIYNLVGSDESINFIVQLGQEEKQLATGSSYRIGEGGEAQQEAMRSSFLPWLVPVVLLLLIIEWEVYRRGIARR